MVPDVISSLQNPSDLPTWKVDKTKAAEKLNKVFAETDMWLLVKNLNQKNNSEV